MDVAALSDLRNTRRLVIKVGSALLVQDGAPRAEWLATLAAEIAELRHKTEIIVVSSGAIALGAAKLGLAKGGRGSLADAQAAASVGQVELARLWADALGAHAITAAQMLVTLGDLEDRRRYLNASATLARLLEAGALPVVNENDSVATEELKLGDNDRLSAHVAELAEADLLLLLSDVDGLYDRHPSDPEAAHVGSVTTIDDAVIAMAGGAASEGVGTGGMATKLAAARHATARGCATIIADGRADYPVRRLKEGARNTLFVPAKP